jgi:CRP-like cAMP-binding protein
VSLSSGEGLHLLRESPFFEGLEEEHLKYFARHARRQTFEPGERIIVQGAPATTFYVLNRGKIELSFRKLAEEMVRNEELGSEVEGQVPSHIMSHRGYPIGWASIVEPHHYRATATALERTEMAVLDRDLFEEYAKQRPDFGIQFMRRVLWLIGNHLRMTRTRLVAARYGNVPQTVRALLDQNAVDLSVTSSLHKIPHYLENRLTVDDAQRTLEVLKAEGDEVERELAAQIADLLDEVWREVKIFRQLQSIYELVAGAPSTMNPEELRRRSSEAFAELFENTDYVVRGQENLPDEPGHIFVMNHLSNHLDNLLPNDFIPPTILFSRSTLTSSRPCSYSNSTARRPCAWSESPTPVSTGIRNSTIGSGISTSTRGTSTRRTIPWVLRSSAAGCSWTQRGNF